MMKVALLFFGQPRFIDNDQIERVYKETIIDKYETDVFCHTWWKKTEDVEYDYSSWSRISKCPIPNNALELIEQKYNPKILKWEEPKIFEFPPKTKQYVNLNYTGKHPEGHWNEKNYSNIMSQLYSIKSVSEIVDEYQKNYDWIVLARYDTILVNFPDLNVCDPSKFYLPGHHPRFPDTIQFFSPKYLEWSKNAFDDVDDVYDGIWEPSPEAFKMGSFLKRFSINDLAPCPMDAHAVRS